MSTTHPKPMGRPPKPPDQRTRVIAARLWPPDLKLLEELRQLMTPGDGEPPRTQIVIRDALRDAVRHRRRELEPA